MDIKTLSGKLQENGVVGAGGAGVPTYAKLDERANTIILNCAECEPLLKLHQQLLEKYALSLIPIFTIASRTGEGLTSASTFTKRRRCVMSDSLCIR